MRDPSWSVTYTTAHGNARSLIHWERSGMEPTSSWILVVFVTAEPWWEFQVYFSITHFLSSNSNCLFQRIGDTIMLPISGIPPPRGLGLHLRILVWKQVFRLEASGSQCHLSTWASNGKFDIFIQFFQSLLSSELSSASSLLSVVSFLFHDTRAYTGIWFCPHSKWGHRRCLGVCVALIYLFIPWTHILSGVSCLPGLFAGIWALAFCSQISQTCLLRDVTGEHSSDTLWLGQWKSAHCCFPPTLPSQSPTTFSRPSPVNGFVPLSFMFSLWKPYSYKRCFIQIFCYASNLYSCKAESFATPKPGRTLPPFAFSVLTSFPKAMTTESLAACLGWSDGQKKFWEANIGWRRQSVNIILSHLWETETIIGFLEEIFLPLLKWNLCP